MNQIAAKLLATGLVKSLDDAKMVLDLWLQTTIKNRNERNLVKCQMHIADLKHALGVN